MTKMGGDQATRCSSKSGSWWGDDVVVMVSVRVAVDKVVV